MGYCSPTLCTKQKGPSLPTSNEKASHHVTLQSHQLEDNSHMIGVRARIERNQQKPVL